MDGFQRRKEQKKHNILQAALTLFMEHGMQKVSMAEIAQKAKVSQVTIYNYFESKHNLTHEVFIYYLDKSSTDFEEIVHSDIPFPEKIKQIIFTKKEVARQIHDEFYQYIMTAYTSDQNYAEKIYVEKVIPYFTLLFIEGKDQGFIDPNISNEAILFYIKMLKEYTQQKDIHQKILPLTEDIMKIFFYGILGERQE